jgi:hypothetical protein
MSGARSLEVVGPFKGASGYDRHTREFVRQLVAPRHYTWENAAARLTEILWEWRA